MDQFEKLVRNNYEDPGMILKAYDLAKEAHKNQKRGTGEPYIVHPVSVATKLIDLGMDEATVTAGLLHDVVEDTPVSYKKIKAEFGSEVESLVKGVSKISSFKYNKSTIEMDSLRRLFMAMSKDIRVILIKLCDRMHNMETISGLPYERQIKFCTETMNLFVPLAERLGLNSIKIELEDMCFAVLNPEEYNKLKAELDRKYEKNTKRMADIELNLKKALENLKLHGEVQSRFKHFYSLYKKIKDKGTAKIYDIIAFRILVDNVDDCYRVLGEVHKFYKPVAGRIKDYIASPKQNGYKSLHTTLITKDGTPFEVQIRTFEMHKLCEYGIAAHWRYKSGDTKVSAFEDKLNWVRSVIENEKQIKDSENFVKALQMDFSNAEIWVFTPKFKPISLPENSTPIDMAYAVHTDLGNSCVAAKVNGKKSPLNRRLTTGDVVEIITSKDSLGPSREWLGFAVSAHARNEIKNFFKRSLVPEMVKKGRDMLEERCQEMGVPLSKCLSNDVLREVKKKYYIYSLDDMFASVATHGIHRADIINIAMKKSEDEKTEVKPNAYVYIEGSEIADVKFARCCTPIPGEEICAIASNAGITVHCTSCANVKQMDRDRLLSAEWKDGVDKYFEEGFKIGGKDEDGLLSDILDIFYDAKVPINSINAHQAGQGRFEIIASIKVKDKAMSDEIMEKLENLKPVQFVNRNNQN